MLRRVSWVRSWRSVSKSGGAISVSSRTTVAVPLRSVASTPALPMAISALRHWIRVFGMAGASRSALTHSWINRALSNCTR